MKSKITTVLAVSVMAWALAGCVATLPTNYAPSSTMTAAGTVNVTEFKYLPSINGKMKPNQLRNSAVGSFMLDKNVDKYFRDAVFTELRFVGVKMGSGNTLSGEIKEFFVDDLGYSVDWTVDVHYVVADASGKTVYDSEKVTKNNTTKFLEPLATLNAQIRQNIELLIKDPDFIKAIN